MVNLRAKLDDKSVNCVFIGYATQSKAYRLYNPVSKKVIISRNVVFDEESKWNWKGDQNEEAVEQRLHSNDSSVEDAEIEAQGSELEGGMASPLNVSPSSDSGSSGSSAHPSPRRYRTLADLYRVLYENCDFALSVT